MKNTKTDACSPCHQSTYSLVVEIDIYGKRANVKFLSVVRAPKGRTDWDGSMSVGYVSSLEEWGESI